MSQEKYDDKLRSVNRFIPFLENMIVQLKDPKMKNREQQLSKMESLYHMITDKNKKLKLETLNKCEEVIIKLFHKVKGDNAPLPPVCPTGRREENRKPINLYSIAGESLNKQETVVAENNAAKSFMMRKPPISYSDLECLEKDVVHELEKKMSLNELNSLRSRLCQELEDSKSDQINTTVRNKPVLARMNAPSPDKNKKKQENAASSTKKDAASKTTVPKVLKEAEDIFGNAFSEIDKTYEKGVKKREEKKLASKEKEKDKVSLKQLSEKAASLRADAERMIEEKKTETKDSVDLPVEHHKTGVTNETSPSICQSDTLKANVDKSKESDVEPLALKSGSLETPETKTATDCETSETEKVAKEQNEETKSKDIPKVEQTNKVKSDKDKSSSNRDRKHDGSKKEKSHKSDHKKEKNDRSHKSDHKKDKDDRSKDKEKARDKKDKDERRRDSLNAEKDKNVVDDGSKIVKEQSKSDDVATETAENSIDELSKKIEDEINAKHGLSDPLNRPANRDPRLKFGAMAQQQAQKSNADACAQRLAFKYNPKPKRQDASADIDKNVVDSIEKSMKESNVTLPPPPQLSAPLAPPNDLFSPESPDEIDKAAVPPILNDLLLNPNTTGVINEVVSALRRSNNETIKDLGAQSTGLHFSPPVPNLQYDPPQKESIYTNNQALGFNPFAANDGNNEMERNDYHPPRNQLHYEPPCANQFEDRANAGFFMDRTPRFPQPTNTFVPPTPYITPSTNFVPPSPLYEDNYRDLEYQNFQGTTNQRFFDGDRPSARPKGLLGDAPPRFSSYNQQYGHKNYDNFNRFGQRGCNAMDQMAPYYGGLSRDPRINANRAPQFPGHDVRPPIRESRMTYREYKEQKEREMREKEAMEKEREENEQKIGKADSPDHCQKENENDAAQENADEREKGAAKSKDPRIRSRDRFQRNRGSARYRRDYDDNRYRNDRRERSREKSRYDSKFDKVYSVREKEKDSPLNNIFANKSGKGYGNQYKIPKKAKEEEKKKEDPRPNEESKVKPNKKVQEEEGENKDKKSIKDKKGDEDNVSGVKEVAETEHRVEEAAETNEDVEKSNIPNKTGGEKEKEENILSKFFQNLMKSGNKDEKKGALLSLISTFSDSFSDQQLQKITSIIKSEDVEEEESKKADDKDVAQAEVKTETAAIEPETAKNDDDAETKTPTEEEAQIVETRCKLKNRRKSEASKPAAKAKIKSKSELDRLHDDIREMFIRDGVVTATGKRMCRILKDSSGSPSTENEKTEEEQQQQEEKPQKRKLKRSSVRKGVDASEVAMKELSVVLPKMSLETMKKSEEPNEVEVEENEKSDEDASDKETVEKTNQVKKGRPKKRNSWASGVIKKKTGKSKKKAAESSEKNEEPEAEVKDDQHDIDYYMASGFKKLACKYCDVSTKWIAAHYRSEHPDKEVLSSRLPPYVAKKLIEDGIKNRQTYEEDEQESSSKHDFVCMFCDYRQTTLPKFFRDHVSIHTGEFRHTCPYCTFSRSHIKTMQCHVQEVHADEDAACKKPIASEKALNNRNIYAYVCQACNYIQMSLDNLKRHVSAYHSVKCEIYKVKLNQEEKIEEEIKPSSSERTTRRSVKANRRQDEDSFDGSEEKPIEVLESSNTEVEESSSTEIDSPPKKGRKRGTTFSVPSPAKKRTKRRCTLKLSPDNSEEKKVVDEAVFTSNTDIQEENKRIEEERMKTMQDINSTIKLRTSLDFVEKLSHRLKQEEDVLIKDEEVKEEEEIVEDVVEKLPVSDLPVFEKSAIQNRDLEVAAARTEKKDGERLNPVNDVIEKLQGILGNPSTPTSPTVSSEDSSPPPVEPKTEDWVGGKEPETNRPPPLIHMDNVDRTADKSNVINGETLNVGFVKVIKTEWTYIYVCCVPPCIFSSRDRTAFANHCRTNHQFDEDDPWSTECLECGSSIVSSEDCNLLSSTLNHVVERHSDFLKIGSIRISSNLFPKKGEEGAEAPTISIPSPPDHRDDDDIERLLDVEPVEQSNDDENPFAFKIVNVMSLADDDDNVDVVPDETPDVEKECEPSLVREPSSPQAARTLNAMLLRHQSQQQAVVGRKSIVAMNKFLGNHFDLYKCPNFYCLFTTNNRKMFDIHLKMHPTDKKITNCLYCNQVVYFYATGAHYEKMHGMCRFSCYYCLYRCIAKDYMDIHQLLVHPDMPSRMQLLPKRDSDEKSLFLLAETAKNVQTPNQPYTCCKKCFQYQMPFLDHLETCPNNTKFQCYYRTGDHSECMAPHATAKELVKHWGTAHGVYPLQCAYCKLGDFDVNVMMVHLVHQHPTQLPDIIDRYNPPVSASKKQGRVNCNFQMLVRELKTAVKPQTQNEASETPAASTAPVPTPSTMQKAFENFALKPAPLQPIAPKATTTTSPNKTSPSVTLTLKPTSKANALNAGGVVYCLPPTQTHPNSVLKAIVVNKEPVKSPQKVHLVSPKDKKFQILGKFVPLAPTMPKLTPLNAVATGKAVPQPVVADDPKKNETPKEDGADVMESLEEPMVVIDDDLGEKDVGDAVDPLSLDDAAQPPQREDEADSKDADQQEVLMQKTGLVGYQLYRCAKCAMCFSGPCQFKDHLICSERCKFDNPSKPYKCYHCGKFLKYYTILLDHLGYHGHSRFTCSLCNKKFPHVNQARYHLKTQHNVVNVQMQPEVQNKSNLNSDSFIAKPMTTVKVTAKEDGDALKPAEVKTTYYSFEADQIPQKSILGYDITCGHCKKFKNKVRSNIVRHLLLHQNDKDFTVPDTAPVNPVPCLEKNEKMFDKMYNLASSSHTGGRMGGQQKGESNKDKVKDPNYPAFVPSNKRYQCCAVGCNYLCLEEGNLRHHLTALHMEDLSFVCVHCKKDLSDAADVDTIIKHLKLHDLHLYKCSSCDYMHNLKHKIERHIGEDHENKESVVVVIRAMDAEPFDENQQQQFTPAAVNVVRTPKPWRCCMCKNKYKCQTEEEVVNHVKNKHDLDCRYKCALCAFKTNEVARFKEHFSSDHAGHEIDIISVYQKDDESNGVVSENEQFDTTPLWLRDKPRVRHIRGILFDEDTTSKKKTTTQVKPEQTSKEVANVAANKKRKRSVCDVKHEGGDVAEPKKEKKIVDCDDVIVIEDDDDVEAVEPPPSRADDEIDAAESGENGSSDVELICTYGDFGMPLNKHFKCPKCVKYRTTKMRDFVQHVTAELRYYRYLCTLCDDKFFTLEDMQMHCIDYHDCSVKSVRPLPADENINKWLTLLLKEQRNIIKGLGFACEEIPDRIEDFLGSSEISSNKSIKCKECGFLVTGPAALDRHMKYNHPHVSFKSETDQQPQQQQRPSVSADKKRRSEDGAQGSTDAKKTKPNAAKTNLLAKDMYVCDRCGAEFNSVPEMEYHGKDVHAGWVEYTVKTTDLQLSYSGGARNFVRCNYCPFNAKRSIVARHIAVWHPDKKQEMYRFSCGVCRLKFEKLRHFKQHFKSHDLPNLFYYDINDKRIDMQVVNTPKQKKYTCPMCPYVSYSVNSANIRHHMSVHVKTFQCDLCKMAFKSRPSAKAHHVKEHPHNQEQISTVPEMMDKLSQLMEEVTRNSTEVIDELQTVKDDLPDLLQPEVILSTEETDVETLDNKGEGSRVENERYFARKSTGLNVKPDETKDYYSFYGCRASPVDMRKITTNFEVADARMQMSCEQLGKIYNLEPVIRVRDCLTIIIDEEDEVSS